MNWEGTTALVTGASRGLGKATAIALAEVGVFVGIGYNNSEKQATETLEFIQKNGGNGSLVAADISDAKEVDRAYADFIESRGRLDFLVNNAAVRDDRPFAMMSQESWSAIINTNLTGTFNSSKAVIRTMVRQHQGVIVNISSVAGIGASPGQVNYAASKGGVVTFTRTLAAELAPQGIRVNGVVPGMLNTGMALHLDQRKSQVWKERIPLSRFGEADEVVKVILFLLSDDSSYITGQSMIVDGGLTL